VSLEETIIGGAVTAVAAKLLEERPKGKKRAQELRERLDILEAERLILTIELRSALMRAAKKLLPQAIRQATGQVATAGHKGRKRQPGRAPSPALLRLIARLAMRNTQIERPPKP